MPTYTAEIERDGISDLVEIEADSPEAAQWALQNMLGGGQQAPSAPQAPQAPQPAPQQAQPEAAPIMLGAPVSPFMSHGERQETQSLARTIPAGVASTAAAVPQMAIAGAGLIADRYGFDSAETMASYNDWADSYIQAIGGEAMNTEAGKAGYDIARYGSAMALGSLSPGGATYWGGLAKTATMGAFGAGLEFEKGFTTADKTRSMALGAVLSGGMMAGLSLPGGLSNARRWFVNKMNSGGRTAEEAQAFRDELNAFFPGLGDELTLGQASGSPTQLAFESRAAGEKGFASYRKQAQMIMDRLNWFGKRYGGNWDPIDLGSIAATRGQAAVRQVISDLSSVRREEWDGLMKIAEGKVTREVFSAGDDLIGSAQDVIAIPGDLKNEIIKLGRKYGLTKETGDSIIGDMSPAIRDLVREWEVAVQAGTPGISLQRLFSTMRDLGKDAFVPAANMSEQSAIGLGRDLRKLVFGLVDNADEASREAVKYLKAARNSWSQRSFEIEAMRNSAIARHLGLDAPVATPAAALRALGNMEPNEALRVAEMLSKSTKQGGDPKLLSEIRKLVWDENMQRATLATSAPNQQPFDVRTFSEGMLKYLAGDESAALAQALPKGAQQSVMASLRQMRSLFSEADRADLRKVLPMLREINVLPPKGASAPDIEGMVMTAGGAVTGGAGLDSVQRAMPFITRQLYRVILASHPDKALFTKEGRRRLTELWRSRGNDDLFSRNAANLIAWAQVND